MERLTQNNFDYCLEMCEPETQLDCAFYMSQTECVCGEAAIYNKLREYENAEQEGRLVVLPCKVGDTIYRFSRERDEVWDWEIEEIRILSGYYCDPISFVDDSENEFFASDIGKTVFLTHAEAEKAMEVSEDV